MSIISRILEWIGRAVIFILYPIRWVFSGIRGSFRTTRSRVRWTLVAVIMMALITATYNDARYYNAGAHWANAKIKEIEHLSTPSQLAWVKSLARLQLPLAPDRPFKLGLDLVGGTQLLYDADTSKIADTERSSALEGVRDVIERRVNAFGVAEPLVQTDHSGNQWRVLVELAGVKDVDQAIKQIGETPLLEFKEENAEAGKTPVLTPAQQKEVDTANAAALKKANDVLKQVLRGGDFAKLAEQYSDDTGTKNIGGDLGWVKQGAFVPEFDQAIFSDLKVGQITPKLVKSQFGYHIIQKLEERGTGDTKEVHSRHILIATKSAQDYLPASASDPWKNTELSGKQLSKAIVDFNQQTNEPQVSLTFDSQGAKFFEDITRRNVGKPIAIFLDNQVISAPKVNDAISGGQAVITGSFTVADAKLLAQRLNAGALPVPITLVSQQRVGASLGEAAVKQSLRAGLYGFLLVALFMILYYRLPGLLAVLALAVYVSVALAIFKFWPVTLTLAGIAGFILSIGMAVDANVLIFERLREELRRGRPLPMAMSEGFQRAWTSIRDSNASSLITCVILYWFGSSVVKGFAFTLAIGILVSMFSAITITRTFVRFVIGERHSKRLWLFGISEDSVVSDKTS